MSNTRCLRCGSTVGVSSVEVEVGEYVFLCEACWLMAEATDDAYAEWQCGG